MGLRYWSALVAVCCCLLAALTPAFASDTTERVSVNSDEVEGNAESYGPSISADGRYVAFHSYASNLVEGDTNGTYDVFVRDRDLGTTGG